MFKAIKKPIPLRFRIAGHEEVIHTLEGCVTAKAGDAIMTGVKGEVYPIKGDVFAATYVADYRIGTAVKKAIVVEVEQMPTPFECIVGWSRDPIHGAPGDYRVRFGENDYAVVAKDIFQQTYEVLVNPM